MNDERPAQDLTAQFVMLFILAAAVCVVLTFGYVLLTNAAQILTKVAG